MKLPNSLSFRIISVSGVGLLVSLLVVSFIIYYAFEKSLSRNMETYLSSYLDLLIAHTKLTNEGTITFNHTPALDSLPRYWQVSQGSNIIAKSALLTQTIIPDRNEGLHIVKLSPEEHILYITNHVTFPKQQVITYLFGMQTSIANAYLATERRSFFIPLLIALLMFGLFLTMITLVQLRLLLQPLHRLKTTLRYIRSGKINVIGPSEVPSEITPLVDEINSLVHYTEQLIHRYRTFASNLSHGLKTPLTILHNEAKSIDTPLSSTVLDKSSIMLGIIDRNLARVSMAGAAHFHGEIQLYNTLNRLINTYQKLFDKTILLICDSHITLRADESDVLECCGNILENACKFAHSTIHISVLTGNSIHIIIEDDGPSIPDTERQAMLERGTRLDQTIKSTGIGLPISQDIIHLYNGTLTLEDSTLGGLKVIITLPVKTE